MKQENENNDIVTDIIELIDFEEILGKQTILQSENNQDLRDNWLALYGAIFSEQFAEEGNENRAVTHSLSMMLITRQANDDNYTNKITQIEDKKIRTVDMSLEANAKRSQAWRKTNHSMCMGRKSDVRTI